MHSQQQISRKRMAMGPYEIAALQRACATSFVDIDILRLIKVLRQCCIIDDVFYHKIVLMNRMGTPCSCVLEALANEITQTCTLEHLIQTLYDNDFKRLAEKLTTCHQECQGKNTILHINQAGTIRRHKTSDWFKLLKELVQDKAFTNPYLHFRTLGETIESRILQTTNDMEKKRLCDQFITLKAIQMDTLTNTTLQVSKNHQGYLEIEKYITSSSDPELSKVILYSRQSIAVSTTENFDEASEYNQKALYSAYFTESCVEITDMLYKSVVVKLSILEKNPNDENLRNSILHEADKAMSTLKDKDENERIFWTKAILLRMTFAHLGIGKYCRIVRNYVPNMDSIVSTQQILQHESLKVLEHRRQMIIAVARARLAEFTGNTKSAIKFLQEAKRLVNEGKYAEQQSISEYEHFLKTGQWTTVTSAVCRTSVPVPLCLKMETGTGAINISETVSLNLSSFETTGSPFESIEDEDTEVKQFV